jgi:hypothetical protein
VAAAPHGGSIVSAYGVFYYVDETKRHIRVNTSPSITQVRLVEDAAAQPTDFSFCGHAVGPSDAIYVVCSSGHVYRATP